MDVSFVEVKAVVDELPIGYYAKRRIGLTLDKDGESSYYNPCTDEIVVSYPLIARGLKNAKGENDSYKETAIRSMVYHEVSHAIITPSNLKENANQKTASILNVFEDERIETILKDFYRGVNFKKNALYINGGKIKKPTNAFSAFYNLVRFRACKNAKLLDRVDQIIKDYNDSDFDTWYYKKAVQDLYNAVEREYGKDPEGFSPSEEELQSLADEINDENNGKGYDKNDHSGEKKLADKDKDESKSGNGEGENGEGEGEGDGEECDGESEEGDGDGEEDDDNTSKKPIKNGKGGQNSNPFEKFLKKFHDTKMVESFKAIISTFNKKNSNGSGCHGYSGIFNPRNVKNENYKYFDRKLSAKGNNRFGKFHLNLFIDESGSFSNLQDMANKVIYALNEVEKTNPNFSFDLICDSDSFRETDKKHRQIKANGGNGITYEEVVAVMKKHVKKDAYVYNIVLHDGYLDWAWRRNRSWCNQTGKNPFLGWDRNNVTIIDTGDNKDCIDECKNVKVVYSPYEDLVVNLGEQVGKALQNAFR